MAYGTYAGPGYPGQGWGYGAMPSYGAVGASAGLKGRPVSSLDEVRAAQIDFDGSLFVFPDIADKKIYTKQINLDGTAATRIYQLVEEPIPQSSTFVTREEFDSAIETLKSQFKKEKEISHESKPKTGSNSATITF